MTKSIKGMPITPGIAYGTAFVIPKKPLRIVDMNGSIEDVDAEIHRFEESLSEVKKELLFLKEELPPKATMEEVPLIDVQTLIVDDEGLMKEIKDEITHRKVKLERAIIDVIKKYAKKFKTAKDPYLRDKMVDVKDVLLRIKDRSYLEHQRENLERIKDAVLISEEILPSLMLSASRQSFVGVVTVVGGLGSHATVLARSYGIPAVGVARGITRRVKTGEKVLVDGLGGLIYVNPDNILLSEYEKHKTEFKHYRERVLQQVHQIAKSKDNIEIHVHANCGTIDEVTEALDHGADGIGLFRTEFIFHSQTRFPTEDEQFEIYKRIALKFRDKPVAIRTLDIGGDKTLPYFIIPKQMNPYLGWRSLKISFDHPDEFKAQIKAILRASCYGNLKILFPMVTNYSDVTKCKEFMSFCENELEQEGKDFKRNMAWGAMLETPSSVICFSHIANEVDFLSIGTNDLIQHVLVVDRDNPKVSEFYVPHHPAVVAVLKDIIDKAESAEKPVSLCGEMARNPYYLVLLLGLGLRHFSMAPTFIPMLKDLIKHIDLRSASDLALEILDLKTSGEVIQCLTNSVKEWYPDVERIIK